MELREWKYINNSSTNAVSTSAPASTSSNTGFKKRFERLIKYHGRHPAAAVEYILVGLLTKDKLEFAEHYDDGQVVEYKISIDPTTEAWEVKRFVNNQLHDDLSGTHWISLLKTLSPYLTIPVLSTPEYRDILHEWVVMNNKTSSSSGYKKRFEKLIKYHIDHASSELESITRKVISNWYFRLIEHYNTGSQEFDRDIIVGVNKATDTFYLSIFVDGKQVYYHNDYKSYEEVLEILTDTYMFLPDAGTPDYDDLLTESLNEWQLMSPQASSSQPASIVSSKTNKEKFAELVAYMQKHKDSSTIFTSVNGPNDTGFEYEEQRASADGSEYNLSVEVNLSKHDLFTIHIDKDGKRVYNIMAKGWEDLLRYLRIYFHAPKMGSPEYVSLTESTIADDFKLYENLWD